jgi:hypothetical protein
MTALPFTHEGRYRCPLCPRAFHALADKKHHVKTKHPKKPETSEPEGGEPHTHEWEVEYLPDPTSAGSVVRSGDLHCACGAVIPDA